jgi:hydroxypyruvate reductase
MDTVAARHLLRDCFEAALEAVDPEKAVATSGVLGDLGHWEGRVVVLALGKAAPAMARGAEQALGATGLEGIVVTNHLGDVPKGMELIVAGHPVPDKRSLAAGEALLEMASGLQTEDVAIVLISGGGSALAEAPVAGLNLADIAATNETLLRSGADIVATNTVRRKLSRLKGGGLAAAIAPARLITLAISDVVGDHPEAIASGPTVESADAADAAMGIVDSLGIAGDLPTAVVAALDAEAASPVVLPQQEYTIVAGAATAAHAAAEEAERRGVAATVVTTRLTGEAAEAAGEVLELAGPGLSVAAGETTVTVSGDGIGGRNHEAALTAATIIDGRKGVWFLAAGTDGVDGTADAAGAIVDGGTIARSRAAGLDAGLALERNDSGSFFRGLGERIITGPTGTNVGDIWLVLRT